MRILSGWMALAVGVWAAGAGAEPNDFRVYQLGNPSPGGLGYDPSANARFRVFARELAAGLTSVNLSPPETLGHAGFAVNSELSVVNFQTQSFVFPTQQRLDDVSSGGSAPSGTVLVPSVHVRKGLPFSLEVGTRVAWIEKSRMGAATLEAKWALNEGFAYLPDVGIRAFATRLLNSRDFDLTAGGVDLGVGKQFAVGGMLTLTPYVGWNLVWVSAIPGDIDFNPGRSTRDATADGSRAGQLSNITVYENVDFGANAHSRFYGGLRFIGGPIQLGAELSYSSLGKFKDVDTGADSSMPRVLAFNSTIGLDF